jgi:hypothetical protein
MSILKDLGLVMRPVENTVGINAFNAPLLAQYVALSAEVDATPLVAPHLKVVATKYSTQLAAIMYPQHQNAHIIMQIKEALESLKKEKEYLASVNKDGEVVRALFKEAVGVSTIVYVSPVMTRRGLIWPN